MSRGMMRDRVGWDCCVVLKRGVLDYRTRYVLVGRMSEALSTLNILHLYVCTWYCMRFWDGDCSSDYVRIGWMKETLSNLSIPHTHAYQQVLFVVCNGLWL